MVDSNSTLVTVMKTMHSETDLHSQFVNIFSYKSGVCSIGGVRSLLHVEKNSSVCVKENVQR